MTDRQTGQEKIEVLTQKSTSGDVADAFITRYSEAFDVCVSNLPTTREFLDAEGLQKLSQMDADGKRRHRAFLLRRMKEAVQTGYLCDRNVDSVDSLTERQRTELAGRIKVELAKWQR